MTFGAALIAAAINAVFGLLVAWVLVRYDFPVKRLFGALVDLPFALPTAVAGIALTALYADTGLIGRHLEAAGLADRLSPGRHRRCADLHRPALRGQDGRAGLAEVSRETEEAALTLGASRLQTFTRVILPTLFPALATGFTLAFARGAGEYGSVIFIAGNMPFRSEIAPLLIITQLEEYDYRRRGRDCGVMLFASFAMLLVLNLLQHWQQRRLGS